MERVLVIESLFTFATSSREEEYKRQVQAISAVTALYTLQEGQGFRRRREFSASETKLKKVDTPLNLSKSLPLRCKPSERVFCLGDKELRAVKRLRSFHSDGDRKSKHLRHHPERSINHVSIPGAT